MSEIPATPWHRESWDGFLYERLPELLAERLPLGGYRVANEDGAARVTVSVAGPESEAETVYVLPVPAPDGIFTWRGRPHVVVPTASSDELDTAEVRCAGEQAYELVAARLGQAPADVEWDEARIRTWLPLEEWMAELMRVAQPLDTTNWLSRHTHTRRLILPDDRRPSTPSQFGRACPFETPEGPNLGRVLTIARGAEVRGGRVVVVEESPAAGLGLTASMVPFVEHSDAARLVMACNMMRQWLTPPDPEPALVQTGNEPPDAPDFWCGRSLLTAYVMRGCDTFEDSILVSESCARRLGYPEAAQLGDKLSNRSGNKGVISRIVPDDEMPHLPDGTPVELVFSPLSIPSRMTWGQLREAALSWVARRQGRPVVAPSFDTLAEDDVRRMLAEAGGPEGGQQTLLDGKGGLSLALPSAVGWVYWGKLVHRSGPKLHATTGAARGQRVGEPELRALLHCGATETIRELFSTRATGNPSAAVLADRLAQGGLVEQASAPAPGFARLQRRLAALGIRAAVIPNEARDERSEGSGSGSAPPHGTTPGPSVAAPLRDDVRVAFSLAEPEGDVVELAAPVAHPWLPERTVERLGSLADLPQLRPLRDANARLARMLERSAPGSLLRQAQADLAACVAGYADALVDRQALRSDACVTFTGRAVAVPDCSLHYDQVGLPETMAWTLFGPLVSHQAGRAAAGPEWRRTPEARQALEAVLARSWVLLARVVVCPAPFVAFRPVLGSDPVLRVHPFTCRMLNADFDGDEPIVYLPVTEAGQREAGEKLTIEAHVRREVLPTRRVRPLLDAQYGPFLYNVRPTQESRFGLAWLARTPEGHAEVERLAGVPVALEGGVLTGDCILAAQMALLERGGVREMLEAMHRLMVRGYEVARTTGASFSAFEAAHAESPPAPSTDDPDAWSAHHEEWQARLSALFDDPAAGGIVPRLMLRSGARGTMRQWIGVVGERGVVRGPGGTLVPIKHGMARGLTAQEAYLCTIGMKEGLARAMGDFFEVQSEVMEAEPPAGHGVLARAMRARRPGVVFARAAAAQEVDPLDSVHARLFVGLPAR